MLRIRNRLLATSAIVLVIIAAGCGGTDKTTPDTSQVTTAPTQSSASLASATAKSTSAPAAGDSRNFDDLTGSLDALKSYRMRFTYAYDGKNEKGESEKGSIEFMQEYIAASKDQHTRMTGMGANTANGQNGGAFETYQVSGTTYMYNAGGDSKQQCISFSSGDDKSNPAAMYKPGDMLGGLHDATLVAKGESVNGVIADHYAANEKDLNLGLFTAAKVDLWVAQEGGYVVKYVGEASGKTALLGKSADGTFKWEYNIEDANKIESIALPPECASAKPADDIPIPATATDKANFGLMISFKTPDDASKVTDYYKQELPAKGWKEGEGGLEGVLTYTKDNRTLTIMITKEDAGGSSVVINETDK